MIISNDELQIQREDRQFDIISQIIKRYKNDVEEIKDIFLEQIEFIGLNETKRVVSYGIIAASASFQSKASLLVGIINRINLMKNQAMNL